MQALEYAAETNRQSDAGYVAESPTSCVSLTSVCYLLGKRTWFRWAYINTVSSIWVGQHEQI